MLLDSVRSFKKEIADQIRAAAATHDEVVAFGASEAPMPTGVALGVARRDDGEHLVAIRTADPVLAAALAARAGGEADVRIVRVTVRATPAFFRGTVRPLEPGAQLNIEGAGFVGTAGAIVKDSRGYYVLSNSHVLADVGRTPPGTRIAQPLAGATATATIGVLDRFVPISPTLPNLVDCALARIDRASAVLGFHAGIVPNTLSGVRPIVAGDLGGAVVKAGRTTGVTRGRITAVEVDGLRVDMGPAGVMTFNDQVEASGGTGPDFSAAGDSGSLIVTPGGEVLALLFAGGRDGTGEDLTFGNYASNVFERLGVELAL